MNCRCWPSVYCMCASGARPISLLYLPGAGKDAKTFSTGVINLFEAKSYFMVPSHVKGNLFNKKKKTYINIYTHTHTLFICGILSRNALLSKGFSHFFFARLGAQLTRIGCGSRKHCSRQLIIILLASFFFFVVPAGATRCPRGTMLVTPDLVLTPGKYLARWGDFIDCAELLFCSLCAWFVGQVSPA